jgi:hypothetical protein
MFKKLYSIKEKIVNAAVSHPKVTTIGTSLAVGAGIVVAAAAGNTTGGAHSSSILTTHTAGTPTHAPQCLDGTSPNAR